MCGSLRGSSGGVKQVSRQNGDEAENDARALRPMLPKLWTRLHGTAVKSLNLKTFLAAGRRRRRKKSKKIHKHSCVFSAIRIDDGHRRGGHWFAITSGRLAQLVERFVYTEDVGSSSLSSPTISSQSPIFPAIPNLDAGPPIVTALPMRSTGAWSQRGRLCDPIFYIETGLRCESLGRIVLHAGEIRRTADHPRLLLD